MVFSAWFSIPMDQISLSGQTQTAQTLSVWVSHPEGSNLNGSKTMGMSPCVAQTQKTQTL